MSTRLSVIGQRLPKVDAWSKVTGAARYTDDLPLPGALCGRLLRSPHAHARIRGIDTTAAASLPGVAAVITGRDLPNPYGILPISQDEHGLTPDKARFVGDPVAAVAASDDATAERALAMIRVDYEPLPAYLTAEGTLGDVAEPIHALHRPGNIHKAVALAFGDVNAGLAAADLVQSDHFFYAGNTHAALELHAVAAVSEPEGRLTLWSSTQTPHYVQRALARALDLPASRIRVIAPALGGGFGGKTEALPHEVAAAKLALVTGRPVKIRLTREDVFYSHRGRHPMHIALTTGVRQDGTITAMHLSTVLDGGAYASYGVASMYYSGALQTVTYRVPAYRFDGARVYTNKPPCGPKRGHGTPQPRFALEVQLDKIAEALAMNPAELRLRNLVNEHSVTVNHLRITSCGLRACIERVVEASGFSGKHRRLPEGRGVGLACSSYLCGAGLPIYWNGLPHSTVHVHADRTGSVIVQCGATDIGQGSDSMLAYVTAEVLGLDPADIRLVTADTALAAVDLGSYSSRVTFMAGNAAIQAAERLRDLVLGAVATTTGLDRADLALRGGRVVRAARAGDVMPWAEAVAVTEARGTPASASGTYAPPPLAGPYKGAGVGPSPAYSYSACVVEVDVDDETGQVRPAEVWLAHDGGRALNPTLFEGQIEGGVYMGLGEALMEEQRFRGALHTGPSLLDYKTPMSVDMPVIHPIIVERIDPEGPFGAKEVGQGPLLPVPPALANAVYDAVGVRIDEVPITPDKVLRALRQRARGGAPRFGPKGHPPITYPVVVSVDPPAGAPGT